jgi:molybdate transport system substrate-binding protein
MEAAQAAGLIQGSARTFARNRLVVIVPKDNPAGIKDVKSLAAPGVKLVIADAAVPVGNYTLQALARLAADSAYGPDFRTKTLARVVSTENSVRQVVSKVALGEADAGVVYATDARTDAARLLVIAIPDQYNVVVTYPAAVVQGSKNPALAQAFIDMLLSAGGQATMSAYGFAAP